MTWLPGGVPSIFVLLAALRWAIQRSLAPERVAEA
jgi:hypothetical protein